MAEHPDILKDHLNEVYVAPDELADRIADIFKCPITIEDSNHNVISYSKHRENIDEARIPTIMNRKVPDKVINGLWKKGIMPKLIDSDVPVIIPEIKEIGLGNRVAISIRKDNEILGFIWAHTSNQKMSEEEINLFKEASTYVQKYFLQRRQRRGKSEEGYKDFFWQLLRGDLHNDKETFRRAKQYNMNIDGNMAIVLINFSEEVTEQMEKHAYYLSETQVKVSIIARLFDDKDFIMLVKLTDEANIKQTLPAFIQQFIQKMSAQLKLRHVFGAAGLLYPSPQHITDSYKQAIDAIKNKIQVSRKLNGIFLYEDLGVYQFIERLYEFQKQTHYQNRQIEMLRNYDRSHHTFLLPTLTAYLEHDSNVNQAAKALFIHPNTMNYRLKRIREVSKVNLKDPNQKTILYLDLIIESMKEA